MSDPFGETGFEAVNKEDLLSYQAEVTPTTDSPTTLLAGTAEQSAPDDSEDSADHEIEEESPKNPDEDAEIGVGVAKVEEDPSNLLLDFATESLPETKQEVDSESEQPTPVDLEQAADLSSESKNSGTELDPFASPFTQKPDEVPFPEEQSPLPSESTTAPPEMEIKQPSPSPKFGDSPTSLLDFGEKVVPKTDSMTSEEKPVELPKATLEPARSGRTSSSCSYTAWLSSIDSRVWDLLLWRNPRVTAPVLALVMFVLLSLSCCSVISVMSHVLLLALLGAFTARVVKYCIVLVHKGDDLHPFKDVLEMDLTISEQAIQEYMSVLITHLNTFAASMRDLLLVKDIIPSLKLGLVLYALTYLGAWFNGLTLLTLVVVGIFTVPKFYEVNRNQVDEYVNMAQAKFEDTYKQLQSKVPFLKQKTQ